MFFVPGVCSGFGAGLGQARKKPHTRTRAVPPARRAGVARRRAEGGGGPPRLGWPGLEGEGLADMVCVVVMVVSLL